jgi:2-polyprenyl-3-methyl-5-hydroxy-6-metoxy-1,4-benzoquinol methylase
MFGRSAGGRALDIGAGSLSSSRHLLSAGFTVDVVDPDPHVVELAGALGNSRLLMRWADIRDVDLAEHSYDLIVAMYVLHLIPRTDLYTLMPKIAGWLSDGALFCATFLGPRDSWAPTPWRATVLRPDEVLGLTSGLEAIHLDELEYDGTNVLGQPKHWHTLRCLFRKSAR